MLKYILPSVLCLTHNAEGNLFLEDKMSENIGSQFNCEDCGSACFLYSEELTKYKCPNCGKEHTNVFVGDSAGLCSRPACEVLPE